VPLVGIERRTLAALHTSINTERATPALVEQTIVPTLKEAAANIVRSLRAG